MAVARGSVLAHALVVLLGAGAAAVSPAAAQTPRSYRDGVKAAEKGEWEEAKRLMSAALAERTEERRRYTPHYYLGVALYELGDCDGALGSWAESERQGALGRDELEAVGKGRATCQARLDERARDAAERNAVEALARASRKAEALRSATDPGLAEAWRRGSPSAASRQTEAEAKLAAVRLQIEQAKSARDTAALGRAEHAALEIALEYDSLLAYAARLRSRQAALLSDLRSSLEGMVTAAREALEHTSVLAPFPPEVKKQRADLEGLVAESRNIRPGADTAYLEGLNARLRYSLQRLNDVAADPPPVLTGAVESFFAGDYDKVLELLATMPDDVPRGRAHALLLRAAARYHLWVEQGESDQALLAEAAADAVACRRADASLRPPAALFSPRFRDFFATTLDTPATR